MEFAFALGVTAVAIGSMRRGQRLRLLDVIAVVASIVLPIGMGVYGTIDGALQRLMFAIAYVWYAREALEAR